MGFFCSVFTVTILGYNSYLKLLEKWTSNADGAVLVPGHRDKCLCLSSTYVMAARQDSLSSRSYVQGGTSDALSTALVNWIGVSYWKAWRGTWTHQLQEPDGRICLGSTQALQSETRCFQQKINVAFDQINPQYYLKIYYGCWDRKVRTFKRERGHERAKEWKGRESERKSGMKKRERRRKRARGRKGEIKREGERGKESERENRRKSEIEKEAEKKRQRFFYKALNKIAETQPELK